MSKTTSDAEGYAEIALLIRSFQISKMLEVAATLDLANRIGNECRPAAELARECGADPEMLLRLCRAPCRLRDFLGGRERRHKPDEPLSLAPSEFETNAPLRGTLLDDAKHLGGVGKPGILYPIR